MRYANLFYSPFAHFARVLALAFGYPGRTGSLGPGGGFSASPVKFIMILWHTESTFQMVAPLYMIATASCMRSKS